MSSRMFHAENKVKVIDKFQDQLSLFEQQVATFDKMIIDYKQEVADTFGNVKHEFNG